MTEYEALKVLDKVPREDNVYKLLAELSERAHQMDKNQLNFRKSDPISEIFREVTEKNEETKYF